ncbi:uncharacterized protein A1O9_08356 [Exophiala aquamarina CBS 119918]|uniref:Choloylglycine hydrolase/NAAA C-terminal domain-containing protein n=1 Tax=Exophiala aquamarina CBS 119918 TaxID=1182545 RepID=A0A072P6W9_9EURO|nr:uncharacterized protein A1O9_08356 [Exophiala aquamarina CBS 119918]KEF55606.1 hypothetical protein A1O9_08356 [Exophiala aquamarina CBS 119918]
MQLLRLWAASMLYTPLCLACSRAVYTANEPDGIRVVSGRTLDWFTAHKSFLYAFPAGMDRDGAAGKGSLKWTSKYGSICHSMEGTAITDGLNTAGLTGNILYLKDTNFGRYNASKPQVSVAVWLQYFLDMYPSIAEIAEDLFDDAGEAKYQVATAFPAHIFPVPPLVHISLADPTGNNMILEWIDGKLTVHSSPKYQVMTNEPSYDQQLALDSYWLGMQNITLPGTDRPADRFARLAHYARVAAPVRGPVRALATLQGMIRAVSVPLRYCSMHLPTGGPNVAPTFWRTYADLKDIRYYFESATENEFVWVSLKNLDLRPGTGVRRVVVDVEGGSIEGRHGDITHELVPDAGFIPLPLTDEDLARQLEDDTAEFGQKKPLDQLKEVRSEL